MVGEHCRVGDGWNCFLVWGTLLLLPLGGLRHSKVIKLRTKVPNLLIGILAIIFAMFLVFLIMWEFLGLPEIVL